MKSKYILLLAKHLIATAVGLGTASAENSKLFGRLQVMK